MIMIFVVYAFIFVDNILSAQLLSLLLETFLLRLFLLLSSRVIAVAIAVAEGLVVAGADDAAGATGATGAATAGDAGMIEMNLP